MNKKLLCIISMLLVVCVLFSTFTGCHIHTGDHEHRFSRIVKEELKVAEANHEHGDIYRMSCECGEVSEQTFENGSPIKYEVGSKSDMLDGKKILVVGCSYTYYGRVVNRIDRKIGDIEKRRNDDGYLYQFCKQHGASVNVTNWTYGGHGYYDIFSEKCETTKVCKGVNHLANLTDYTYDYVVLQDIDWKDNYIGDENYVEYVKNIMQKFKEANPDVKFYFNLQATVVETPYAWVDMIEPLEKEGLIVVDWGTLIYDIWTGAVKVPNSKYTYNKQSFIVSNSKEDGYHQNILSGYLTTLMLYCTITGETAIGQPFEFAAYDMSSYKTQHYKYIKETNFDVIMKDAEEMLNLQILANDYIRTQRYTKYCN